MNILFFFTVIPKKYLQHLKLLILGFYLNVYQFISHNMEIFCIFISARFVISLYLQFCVGSDCLLLLLFNRSPLFPLSPESVRQRTDFFYMKPEVSASSDSPLWFSSTPLENSVLARLLTRVLLVRDLYRDNQHEEEGVQRLMH